MAAAGVARSGGSPGPRPGGPRRARGPTQHCANGGLADRALLAGRDREGLGNRAGHEGHADHVGREDHEGPIGNKRGKVNTHSTIIVANCLLKERDHEFNSPLTVVGRDPS